MTDEKKCPRCGEFMVYVDDDPEFGNLGYICVNNDCGRV